MITSEPMALRQTVVEAASRLNVSTCHLQHLVRRDLGISYTKLVRQRRVALVRRMMQVRSDMTISEIAFASGYEPATLYRHFMVELSKPPSTVRTQDARLHDGATGSCVWLTGLPGSGKSATAQTLAAEAAVRGWCPTVLDDDAVRARLTLGSSQADHETTVITIARLAADVIQRGGMAICALVSPCRQMRERARELIGATHFFEVLLQSQVAAGEAPDQNRGSLLLPDDRRIRSSGTADRAPDLVLDTLECSVEQSVQRILQSLMALQEYGFRGLEAPTRNAAPKSDRAATKPAHQPAPSALARDKRTHGEVRVR